MGQTEHNHLDCITKALIQAKNICHETGEHLTPLRQKILQMVWGSHQAVTAYEILSELTKTQKNAAPPTVYRALDFLEKQGLIHKLESLKAFVGCIEPTGNHQGCFLICKKCRSVQEKLNFDRDDFFRKITRSDNFKVESWVVEIEGLCASCQ